MKVKNDFPNVDRVIVRLKEYVNFLKSKKDDEYAKDDLKVIAEFIDAIEKYLDHVCNDEDRIKRFREKYESSKDAREYQSELDKARTMAHSEVISKIGLIDRTCDSYGISRVFDYAEEFTKDTGPLMPDPNDKNSKSKMSERERIKRRELGNFGLYIAASVTVGLEMEDREVRAFASCESDDINWADATGERQAAYYKVKSGIRTSDVSRNLEDMLR